MQVFFACKLKNSKTNGVCALRDSIRPVYDYLKKKEVWHEITEHPAVFNMEELDAVELPYPDCDTKNLLVRDDKRRSYYLITVKGDKRVDLTLNRKNSPVSERSAGER